MAYSLPNIKLRWLHQSPKVDRLFLNAILRVLRFRLFAITTRKSSIYIPNMPVMTMQIAVQFRINVVIKAKLFDVLDRNGCKVFLKQVV